MTLSERFRASDDVAALRLDGGIILYDLVSGNYFSLDRVGTFIWNKISDCESSFFEITEIVQFEFDAPREVIEKDILEFINHLIENNLVYSIEK